MANNKQQTAADIDGNGEAASTDFSLLEVIDTVKL